MMKVWQERIAKIACALILASLSVAVAPDAEAACPEPPACRGCGCKGGPGYRGPDGRCVGYKDLDKVFGTAPHGLCRFENAPGAGLNRECSGAPVAAARSR